MTQQLRIALCFLCFSVLLLALPASGMPGVIIGKNAEKRIVHATHIVVVRNEHRSVVTVMPDYEGPFEPFVMVIPIPNDVTSDRIRTLKRDSVSRVEHLSAPRVWHFWEKDPCSLGKAQQAWERTLKVKEGSGARMMGVGMMDFSGGKRKVPRELSWVVEPDYKTGEYSYTILPAPQPEEAGEGGEAAGEKAAAEKAKPPPKKDEKAKPGKKGNKPEEEEEAETVYGPPAGEWVTFLEGRGYKVSDQIKQAMAPYVAAGMSLLVAEVDDKKMELVSGTRAQLSPIRYWTEQPANKFPVTLGLQNLGDKQELFIYVIDAKDRFEVANYKNVFPPTNIEIKDQVGKLWVQERVSEIYANIHDRMIEKYGSMFLSEYAWPTETCGEPCPDEKLLLYELLSLGGDVLELDVPEEERNPEPPDLTKEEEETLEKELEEFEKKERKEMKKRFEYERKEVMRRKALAGRHKYILSRVHARYDRKTLPKDVEIRPGKPLEGGVSVPKGPNGELPSKIKPTKRNKLQVRFFTLHPWLGVIKCDKPVRWRWGIEWRSVRRWNKIWVAEDLTRKKRDKVKLADAVLSPIPEIGFVPAPPASASADAGVDGGTEEAEKKDDGCGCRVPANGSQRSAAQAVWLLLGAACLLRRRRRRGTML